MLDGQHDPAIRTAVDLANTVKPITGADELETVQQLADFLDRHAPAAPGPRHPTRADLAEVRALRGTVRAVLERASTDAAGTAALINDGLRRSRATRHCATSRAAGGPRRPPTPTAARRTWPRPRSAHWPP
ncbi:ABATE domain-containing protein [Saccharopolyspora gregorii]|uniref:DUF222 domain-containing protein n=1 Tax=Saccharopolyspora gregorii TaxID=33914 RepID=A0ABP6S3N9_9PSEU